MSVNGVQISYKGYQNYPYRAYLNSLINYGHLQQTTGLQAEGSKLLAAQANCIKFLLLPQGFFMDTVGFFANATGNMGHQARRFCCAFLSPLGYGSKFASVHRLLFAEKETAGKTPLVVFRKDAVTFVGKDVN